MTDFRDAHTWLRGYSDALAGKVANPLDFHNPAVYASGYSSGTQVREAGGVRVAA